jgi:hypothetical protein
MVLGSDNAEILGGENYTILHTGIETRITDKNAELIKLESYSIGKNICKD